MGFKEVSLDEVDFNPFDRIGKQWMLIAAGDEAKSNLMTASWGGAGVIWNKNVITTYIRPQRYTKEFIDANETFTVSFVSEKYRDTLGICGSISGRDVEDKWKEAGLTPYYVDGTTGVAEADMILVCRKQYHQDMRPECFDIPKTATENYPEKDYHVMYISEIEKVLLGT